MDELVEHEHVLIRAGSRDEEGLDVEAMSHREESLKRSPFETPSTDANDSPKINTRGRWPCALSNS